ncbi:hypothetical protein EDF62_2703 [Leucobacter luti]|uniref:Uncharacterized protein n=1 Tax=Leucobacter luti TaxID=340320 RepID=A0A4V6PVL6_9MICO|nr:hypothetical protein [Leucobacter luti]TDP90138.1 hypothetical protein EDF62_2703 [Leucobacter luti]
MSVVDTIGIIGELLSWVGAFAGVPFLIAALVIHAVEGPRLPTNVTIIEDLDHRKVAQWAVEERTYSRPLTVEDGPADPAFNFGHRVFQSPASASPRHIQAFSS